MYIYIYIIHDYPIWFIHFCWFFVDGELMELPQDQQSHSSGMAESDAAGNATFASHFLGPQEEEPQILWVMARFWML